MKHPTERVDVRLSAHWAKKTFKSIQTGVLEHGPRGTGREERAAHLLELAQLAAIAEF